MKTLNSKIVFASLFAGAVLYAGPTPFSAFDKNGDGYIMEKEFYDTQAENMAKRAKEGRAMRNAPNAPKFTDMDLDGDGKITENEHMRFQYKRMSQSRQKKQQGMRKGQGQGVMGGQGQGRGGR